MNKAINLLVNNRSRIPPRGDWRHTWYIRQERIKKEGSEPFTWQVPVTAATTTSHIELAHQFPRCKKYLPLDFAEVVNNDVVDFTLVINGSITWPMPAGTIHIFKGDVHIWEVAMTNNDAATDSTLGKVYIIFRRLPKTVDDWARERGY